jgi:hypothetical protein
VTRRLSISLRTTSRAGLTSGRLWAIAGWARLSVGGTAVTTFLAVGGGAHDFTRVLAACLLIVPRPQYPPGRPIDEMQLRAGEASDGLIAVRIGRDLIRRPALHHLTSVGAMKEKSDHPISYVGTGVQSLR